MRLLKCSLRASVLVGSLPLWCGSWHPTTGFSFFVIGLLTYLIALFGFTHIVAGSAEVLYGVLTGVVSPSDAVFHFFLPTLCGNVFGGTVLFAVLSYAQVREEISVTKEARN